MSLLLVGKYFRLDDANSAVNNVQWNALEVCVHMVFNVVMQV